MVDGDKLAIGLIYEAMDQAKERIRVAYHDKSTKHKPMWKIIDNRWNNQLHQLIHAARYYLNPRYHYKSMLNFAIEELGEVKDGLYTFLERVVPNQKTHDDTSLDPCL